MEFAAALLSAVVPLTPALKSWLESVVQRNRSAARAEIIRARSAGTGESRGTRSECEAGDD
ncbi:hypothetical protein AB0I84_14595 [Streptomyces spectabilis]|uniref:hypothetical protein n=1 Tax=Streptomyces spectabilis TaxID=68270 RepID=UPI00340A394B